MLQRDIDGAQRGRRTIGTIGGEEPTLYRADWLEAVTPVERDISLVG